MAYFFNQRSIPHMQSKSASQPSEEVSQAGNDARRDPESPCRMEHSIAVQEPSSRWPLPVSPPKTLYCTCASYGVTRREQQRPAAGCQLASYSVIGPRCIQAHASFLRPEHVHRAPHLRNLTALTNDVHTYTRYDCREFDVHAVTHPYLLHHSSPLVQPNPTVVKTTHNTRDQESSAA